MLAIGALAQATGSEFGKYLPEFYKYLEMGLQNFQEYQVCSITVGVVGDIVRSLNDKILPYCDGIMQLLLANLSSEALDRSVKPPIFSVFSDIALTIEENFEKYVPYVVPMMQRAAELCAQMDANDDELMEYGDQLKCSIFEAYSGILQGFKNSKSEVMLPYAPHLWQFIELVLRQKHRDVQLTKAIAAVMGDLADVLGPNTRALFADLKTCGEFLGECLGSDDNDLKQTAGWTQDRIKSVLVS